MNGSTFRPPSLIQSSVARKMFGRNYRAKSLEQKERKRNIVLYTASPQFLATPQVYPAHVGRIKELYTRSTLR